MASNPPPPPEGSPPPPAPGGPSIFDVWLQRSGIHGKLILGAAFVGLICTFLPRITASGMVSGSESVINHWAGILSLLCFIGCGVLAVLAYQQSPPLTARWSTASSGRREGRSCSQ